MGPKLILTGKPGSGKSTLARWVLSRLPQPWAGYETFLTEQTPVGPLFALRALPSGETAPISRLAKGRIQGIPETFEGLGTQAVTEALTGSAPTLLLDEVGRFEQTCSAFLSAVSQVLASPKAAVVVVKKEDLPHLNHLRETPGALVVDLDVTPLLDARLSLLRALGDNTPPLSLGLTLRLYQGEKSFGPGPMALLEGVRRTGSLHQAAAQMGMAYSKAWKLMGQLETRWGFPLLVRQSGGSRGGGSALTREGEDLLRRYQAVLARAEEAAQQAMTDLFPSF